MIVGALALALLYLAALGSSGVAALRRLSCRLTPLEWWAYGLPLGNVVWSLLVLVLAIVARRLTVPVVVAPAIASVAVALWLWPPRDLMAAWGRWRGRERPAVPPSPGAQLARLVATTVGPFAALVLVGFAVRWTILWRTAFTSDAQGLWAGHIYIWGDWALHLGDVTAFVYGDNFPPVLTRYLGAPLAYHYLPSITAAALVKLGLPPTTALVLHSWVFSLALLFGLYAFARRLTRDRAAAGLAIVLFFLGGTLGWVLRLAQLNRAPNAWAEFLRQPWDRESISEARFLWPNMFFDLIEPQRAYSYGLPLALLTLTLLLEGQARRERRLFVAAGLVAATLPFAHTSTLVALALIVPFAFLFLVPSPATAPIAWGALWREPGRVGRQLAGRVGGAMDEYWGSLLNWLIFGTIWVALAVPQLIYQQGGQRGETRYIRWLVGWVAAPDPWPWFWLKNLGWFIPLLAVALIVGRRLFDGPALRLLWACMPTFAICNLIAFRPWDWDNTKMFLYWFLAVCILVAALLVRAWREQGTLVVRALLVGVVATLIGSGLLINLQQLLGRDRYLFLTTEEIQLAEAVRAQTAPRAVFVAGTQHNHPVPVLAGRQVLMAYEGWMYAFGIDYTQRKQDLLAIYADAPVASALIAKYGIDYIVVGPQERDQLGANVAALRARYGPPVIATGQYAVFKAR